MMAMRTVIVTMIAAGIMSTAAAPIANAKQPGTGVHNPNGKPTIKSNTKPAKGDNNGTIKCRKCTIVIK